MKGMSDLHFSCSDASAANKLVTAAANKRALLTASGSKDVCRTWSTTHIRTSLDLEVACNGQSGCGDGEERKRKHSEDFDDELHVG